MSALLARLRAAIVPTDPREQTLLTGLALLGVGIAGWFGAFVGMAVVGAILTVIGFLGYLFPKAAE